MPEEVGMAKKKLKIVNAWCEWGTDLHQLAITGTIKWDTNGNGTVTDI